MAEEEENGESNHGYTELSETFSGEAAEEEKEKKPKKKGRPKRLSK
jgi:hypothetical protein